MKLWHLSCVNIFTLTLLRLIGSAGCKHIDTLLISDFLISGTELKREKFIYVLMSASTVNCGLLNETLPLVNMYVDTSKTETHIQMSLNITRIRKRKCVRFST